MRVAETRNIIDAQGVKAGETIETEDYQDSYSEDAEF
jgi:hypothetical protein